MLDCGDLDGGGADCGAGGGGDVVGFGDIVAASFFLEENILRDFFFGVGAVMHTVRFIADLKEFPRIMMKKLSYSNLYTGKVGTTNQWYNFQAALSYDI